MTEEVSLRERTPDVCLVWDGDSIAIPRACGRPRDDQLASTPLDNLVELCGRVSYDSLGRGRTSQEYHAHIREVGHLSVQAHANRTFVCPSISEQGLGTAAMALACRPGVYFSADYRGAGYYDLRVTLNARCVTEWDRWKPLCLTPNAEQIAMQWGRVIRRHFHAAMPLAVPAGRPQDEEHGDDPIPVLPKADHEVWASIYFGVGSRGQSHEMVRHAFQCAVSQRSSRYCDESESQWIPHPLLLAHGGLDGEFLACEDYCKAKYDRIVNALVPWLKERGVDGTTARKQARGAARGILGNALETQLIFSANLRQWMWMLTLRAADPADAEIRAAFASHVFPLLRERWPERFKGWEMTRSSDGLTDAVIPPQEVPC